MDSSFCFAFAIFLIRISFLEGSRANDYSKPSTKLYFNFGTLCTYSYQVTVNTARGSKSTANQGYQLQTLVDVIPVHRQSGNKSVLNTLQLKVYQPRLRRLQGRRVVVSHPANADLERKLSNPFYFRQFDHGTVVDAFLPANDDLFATGLKKGIAGAFQVNLNAARYKKLLPVKEQDDSGTYYANYKILHSNKSHMTIQREWTSNDYLEFADGRPTNAEQKFNLHHSGTVHVQANRIHKVHRLHKGSLQPQNKWLREQQQDIQLSTSGYNTLSLVRCSDDKKKEAHHRSRRETDPLDRMEYELDGLHQENLIFKDLKNINWKEFGGDKMKFRPFYELMRCFTDPTVKNKERGECAREIYDLVRQDEEAFNKMCSLIFQRNHQNVTTWSVLVSVVAGRGGHRAQSVLAQALMSEYPRRLNLDEYESLLEGIFYIPKGPIHRELFDALFTQAARESNHGHKSSMAMLVLAGLTKRAEAAGYNSTLPDVVAALIHDSYRNKSNVHDPDSVEHESYVRDHIWAFGNLGHLSGLEVMLKHVDHDSSGVRSAVVSSMRKLSAEHTNNFLLEALYNDEHNDVKAAVIDVFIERHEDLTDETVQALEHAIWHAEDGDVLDASVLEFLENHHNHPRIHYIKKKRNILKREKRALIPFLKPREYKLGPSKRWVKHYGGAWLGAQTMIQFKNQVKFQLGIFGGKFEVDIDNAASFDAHVFSSNFDILKGKAAFKAAATFKNDIPKDLIHLVADIGDGILKAIDNMSSVLVEKLQEFVNSLRKYVPLHFQKIVDFFDAVLKFVENLAKPLKPIETIKKIISFAKNIFDQVRKWQWIEESTKKIQDALQNLNAVDNVFKKVMAMLDDIMDIDKRIRFGLPHNFHSKFNMKDLVEWIGQEPLDTQEKNIKEFFTTIGIPKPDNFELQLPFKFAMHFPLSIDHFTNLSIQLTHLGNTFLDLSLTLEGLRDIRPPLIFLPQLEKKFSAQIIKGFNFGLRFDWKKSLNFTLNLKDTRFMRLINGLYKLSEFFRQFHLHSFDLKRFFKDFVPGKQSDIVKIFKEILEENTSLKDIENPKEAFKYFLQQILNMMDSSMPVITEVSDLSDFLKETGSAINIYASKNLKKLCSLREVALNASRKMVNSVDNINDQGIVVMKRIKETSHGAVHEFVNYTALIDDLIMKIQENVTSITDKLVSQFLSKVYKGLNEIQLLSHQFIKFGNGTSSRITGVCLRAADFSAKFIDMVQNISRNVITELTSFVDGAVSQTVKNVGNDLKQAVTEVERWYSENMARKVGKIPKIANIITDLLSLFNREKGFLGKVQETAVKINDLFAHLNDLPKHATKARDLVDEMIRFADGGTILKDKISKLDIRNQFGITFDNKIRVFCNKFKVLASQTLERIGGYTNNIGLKVENFIKLEATNLMAEAVNRLQVIRTPLQRIRSELEEFLNTISQMTNTILKLKPLKTYFMPVISSMDKLPSCREMTFLFTESIRPCVKIAKIIGTGLVNKYKDLRKQVSILYHMFPETLTFLKAQKYTDSDSVKRLSKAFITQAKIVQKQFSVLKTKFAKATDYTDLLETSRKRLEDITVVITTTESIIDQTKDILFSDQVKEVKAALEVITGRHVFSPKDRNIKLKQMAIHMTKPLNDYVTRAKQLEKDVKLALESTFKSMQNIYTENIMKHMKAIEGARTKVQNVYEVFKSIKDVSTTIKGLSKNSGEAAAFSERLKDFTTFSSKHIEELLSGILHLSDVIKPNANNYISKVKDTFNGINGFINTVKDFLDKFQLRQRGLDSTKYKKWSTYSYCSVDVCLRLLERSSALYYSTIFPWKFPHLDDLSSMKDCGRWLIPGLFDDYKAEGIAQLSSSEIVLGMHGVSVNKDKPSILVVIEPGSGTVKKILQLTVGGPDKPLSDKIGGIAIARNNIWISGGSTNKIYWIEKGSLTGSMSSSSPSSVTITESYTVEGIATSVSFDEANMTLWVTDGVAGKGYGYKLSPNGNMPSSGLKLIRVLIIQKQAQGMTIARQFNTIYAVVSRCAMRAGFQCKLEFHELTNKSKISEQTLSRVVRTPSGLESVQIVNDDNLLLVFSSAVYSEKEKIQIIGGDFEDRYFKIKLPILKMTFGIFENCLMFKVMKDWIIKPRRLLPFGKLQCGHLRRRSIQNQFLESDVYSTELERIHTRRKRDLDTDNGLPSCKMRFRKKLRRGVLQFIPDLSYSFPVYGITVTIFVGAKGYYFIDFDAQVCLKDRRIKVAVIPGAYVNVYAGASVSLHVVEVGVTITATLLETRLIPEIIVDLKNWPLEACLELRMEMTPLKIQVTLWFRLRICIHIRCGLFWIHIDIRWCNKHIFGQWSWSTPKIKWTIFRICQQNIDKTPPGVGKCQAMQVDVMSYLIQWHSFSEDKKINHYRINIGSNKGSDDDYKANVGLSLSTVVRNLAITNGRDVHVSVRATNDQGLHSRPCLCPVFKAIRRGPQIRYVNDGFDMNTDKDNQLQDFVLGMNFAYEKGDQSIVDVKWGISTSLKCTLDESEVDIYGLMPVGETTSIQRSSLSLKHGKKYYTRVVATNSLGLKTVMCSDGIVIDNTPPQPGYLHVGSKKLVEDTYFILSTRRVRVRFQPFTDNESPIVKYEWKISYHDHNIDVTSFRTIPLTQTSPLMQGLNLRQGQKYKVVLQGINAVGLRAFVENSFIVDISPPICNAPFDVISESNTKDLDFARELNGLKGKWNCSDEESGIYKQLIAVGTYPGGADIQPFTNVDRFNASALTDGYMFVHLNGFDISPKARYHLTIKVFNGAGLRRTISSDGISIDKTSPIVNAYFIKDGIKGNDKSFTKDPFKFSVHWEQAFDDAESGLAEYHVGLGTEPGLTDTKKLTSVGKNKIVSLTGLILQSGHRYFATVVGCNAVGMCTNASSNGMVVDYIPPHPGTVITGYKGPPALYQWITNSVWARWKWCPVDEKRNSVNFNYSHCANDSFYDIHSGISGFGLSVTSLANEQLLAQVKKVGRVRKSGRTISLRDGAYSVVVEATDKAGMKSIAHSNIITVDSTPPTIVTVQHGHRGNKIKYTRQRNFTFQSYFELRDNLSMVDSYQVFVGSYIGGEDMVNSLKVVLPEPKHTVAINWTAEYSIKLENNRKYYITVHALNKAGLLGSGSSEALISDNEAPKNVLVSDGWDMIDVDYQSFLSIYRVHWQTISDFSGVHSVYVGLKSNYSATECDVSPLEKVQGGANYYVLSGLNLKSGSTYYACLKVIDNAQNVAYFTSDGMVIDNTPPSPGYVVDGNSVDDIEFQTEKSVLWATWSDFNEEETEIVQYKLAFGTSPGKEDIQAFTEVGLVHKAPSTRLAVSELATAQRYYASVLAINKLGLPSENVSSNGVLVDITPPSFIFPTTDGTELEQDVRYSSVQSLSCSWRCDDEETKLKVVEVSFGLEPGSSDVKQSTVVNTSSIRYEYQTSLKSGAMYFATVRCTNNVDLTKTSTSNGIIYDATPPQGNADDGDYQNSTKKINVEWKFVDPESGIHMYQITILKSDGLSQERPFEFQGNITSATLFLKSTLDVGRKYFINVTGYNGAGLASSVITDGFMIDNTPPTCARVWHGDKDFLLRMHFVSEASSLHVTWNCSDETPLMKLQFAVKEKNSSKFILPFHSINQNKNYTGTASIAGRRTNIFEADKTYVIGIQLTNVVGLTSVFWTTGVKVDKTPPIFLQLKLEFNPRNNSLTAFWDVKDEESGLAVVKWGLGRNSDKTDIKILTTVEISRKSLNIIQDLQPGSTYFFSVEARNTVGLLNRAVSNGVVIDRTRPEAGVVTAQYVLPLNYDRNKNVVPGSSFTVSWTGFVDRESGISQYSWATGNILQSLVNLDDSKYTSIQLEESVGGVQITNVTLVGNTTYYVCIRATNGAGLQRTDCSPGMTVVLGQFSAGVVNDGPRHSKKDLDFQLDDRALWAHWDGFDDPVYGVSSYEWCIGDHPPNSSVKDFCTWPYTKVTSGRSEAYRFFNLTLFQGKTYYANVKAINSQGQNVYATSDGVVVDRSHPEGGAIKISQAFGKDTLYASSFQAPSLIWDLNDKESGMSYFMIGAGTFPHQDDLLRFKKVEGLIRSVSMKDLNFTVSEGLKFFVVVSGFNMLGLETTLTSQQVVVDWTPPLAGIVIDGDISGNEDSGAKDRDYQNSNRSIAAHWYDFEDKESGILQYRWCLGLKQGTCSLTKMVSSGLLNYVSVSLHLEEGVQYFVTVEATNGAGLTQLSSSDGVTIDSTSPVAASDVSFTAVSDDIQLAVIGNRTYQSSGNSIKARWKKITDVQSGITSLKYCVGERFNICNIIQWTHLGPEETSLTHIFDESFSAGTTLYVSLEATNEAGLTSVTHSRALVIDSSPPSIGRVSVRNTNVMKYLKRDQIIEGEAIGFEDEESGIAKYEWAICFAISKRQCTDSFVSTGLSNKFVKDHNLTPGVSYILLVRVYNQVRLQSEAWSNTFTKDYSYPIPKSVFDGTETAKDISIQSSTNTLSANWEPFIDLNSRIAGYELCAGSKPSVCDIEPYRNVGLSLKGEISEVTLEHMKTYHITVRARNEAGNTANASTDGVKIDSTPPMGGEIRDGNGEEDTDYQAHESFISANWDQFTDPESGIEKCIWCAGTAKGSCDVMSENVVIEARRVRYQLHVPVNPGLKLYFKVTAINGGGGKTTLYSDGVVIDSTPPEITEVKDLRTRHDLEDADFITSKAEYCVVWAAIDKESDIRKSEISVCPALTPNSDCLISSLDVGVKLTICMSNLELLEGVKYVAKVQVTNNAGLSSSKTSDGFVLDFSPPDTGEVDHVSNLGMMNTTLSYFTSSNIDVQWHGFWDKESSVTKYFVCLEDGFSERCDDIANFTDVGNLTAYSFKSADLKHNTRYYVSVIAENGAGLQSPAASSVGVLTDVTAPILGHVLHDGKVEGKEIRFQTSTVDIKAHWTICEDPESDIIKVEWCVGTTKGLCEISKMKDISPFVYNVQTVLEKPVRNGQLVYVTVQATNGAGKTTSVTSDGVTIDSTPPKQGKVFFSGNTTNGVHYLFGESDIDLRWMEFADEESGIESYEVAICDGKNLANCLQPYTSVNNATHIQISGLDFENGAMYIAKVRATSFAGLKTEARSKGITVDYSPPSVSRAWLGPEGNHVFFQSSKTELKVRWQLFNDAESGIFFYEICLTTSECNVSDYINVGMNSTSYQLTKLKLEHGESYYVIVKATNGVGLTAATTTDPITIDTTPPKPNININSNKTAAQQILRFNCTEELVTFEWDMFSDPESGMARYELCVGTEKGLCNIVPLAYLTPSFTSRAFIHKRVASPKRFAKFKALNNVGLYSMESEECDIINEAPKVKYVKDLNASNINDDTEIDWTANTTSLRIKWDIPENVTEQVSKMRRIEVAVTLPVSNLSYPRINNKKSWNGEPFALSFTDVQLWKNNLSIDSLDLKPWEEYRSVIRVWNEGQIYSEVNSDGVRLEPNLPILRKLVVQDASSEKERLRWLPNLRLPSFNKSAFIPEIMYISSPGNINVVSSIINITNQTEASEAELFRDSKDFKILVYRLRSDTNATNTSENTLETNTLPGIANPQGPCCANYTPNDVTMLSDLHYKPTLPTEKFGSFVVFLKQEHIAVASSNKVFVFSLQNKSLNHELGAIPETITGISHFEDYFLITSRKKLHVYNSTFGNSSIRVGKMPVRSWIYLDGRIAIVHNDIIAATGRTAQNQGVVGIFHVKNGVWQVTKEIGKTENNTKFAKDLTVNSHFLAVLSSSYVIVYSVEDFEVAMRINLNIPGITITKPSLRLTKNNALILASMEQSKIVILNLDIHTKSYSKICSYMVSSNIKLSGKLDSMDRDGGTIVALGMQTLNGVDGVLLIGFQGAFAYHSYYKLGQCLGLGKVISRNKKSRADDGVPRASVSLQDSTIAFGTPGELTWPDRSEDAGTGKVHVMTYCPLNHKRVKIATLLRQQTSRCEACEEDRKSLGGVSTICTVCKGRTCALPLTDDPFHFVAKVCNESICPITAKVSNKTNGIKMILTNGTFFEVEDNVYTVKIVETTRAGMSTTSESEPFIIDATSPVVGTVFDGLGSDQSTNCSNNETLGEDSQCSTRSFQDTDIDYTNNTSEVYARWIDFADNESDIAEYFWCVGTKPMLDDIRQCESTGQRQNGSHYGLDFQQGDTYYVTVIACNGAQRCSAGYSNGVTIDVTPPTMVYVRDGVLGPDMDYQAFLDIIFAYFKASDEISDISSYEVAWGTAPGLTDMKEYEEIGNTTIWYAKFKDNTLKKKNKYFATVRASNKAGLLSEPMSSDGIVVGKSEYIFDNNASASFFFDTVNVKTDGSREDDGVGETYGTLDVPKGAVHDEIKLKCYSLDNKNLESNNSEDGPVANPSITKPKQFMLGNYSFQIKVMDPVNNTVKEGYKFAKPIKVSMFYDVDKLVRANKRVVNKEVEKEDIDPVLYLWNMKNNTWMDASLTCPNPWQYINRTIKLLTVHICHLTQFAFFWSFKAQNGLMMFDKNSSVFDENGDVIVDLGTRTRHQIDLPIKRSKGSTGNIEVYWSLHTNESHDSVSLWPNSGKISLVESQWKATLSLSVANTETTRKQVVNVRLYNVTGGAILASRDKIQSSVIIVRSSGRILQDPPSTLAWIAGVILGCIFLMIVILWLIRRQRRRRSITINKASSSTTTSPSIAQNQLQTQEGRHLGITSDTDSPLEMQGVARNKGEDDNSSGVLDDTKVEIHVGKRSRKHVGKRHYKKKKVKPTHRGQYDNPTFENEVDIVEMRLEDQNTPCVNKVLRDHLHSQNGTNPSESSEEASAGAIDANLPAKEDNTFLASNDRVTDVSDSKEAKKTTAENRGYNNPSYEAENDDVSQ